VKAAITVTQVKKMVRSEVATALEKRGRQVARQEAARLLARYANELHARLLAVYQQHFGPFQVSKRRGSRR